MMLIGDILNVWRKGQSVANPAAWKNVAAVTENVAGLITSGVAIAAAFGYHLNLSDPLIQQLAGGVAGLLFIFGGSVHIITSEKVGLPSKTDADAGRGQSAVGEIGSDPDYRG